MSKEIERKFLVESDAWRVDAEGAASMEQFYLASAEGWTVRVRLSDGQQAKLTLKHGGPARERDEFEYSIPIEDAEAMRSLAVGRVVQKTRHCVRYNGHVYEVDVFRGDLAGLVMAELETPEEVPDASLPPWLGREVTGEAAYYNASLAMNAAPAKSRRRYRIDLDAGLSAELRRIADGEIAEASASIEAAQTDPVKAPHEARKALKRLRGLLRLVRPADEAFFHAENARWRDVSAKVAGPREAGALIETVDRLAKAFSEQAAEERLAPLRAELVARRDAAFAETQYDSVIEAALASCGEGRERIDLLALPEAPKQAADLLAAGAAKTLRKTRRALDRSRREGAAEDFHDLRKGVKAHAMHVGLLAEGWPRGRRRYRKALDALGERLGELQDIFVLRDLLDKQGAGLGGEEAVALLSDLIDRTEKRLKKESLDEARRLFRAKPGKLMRELRARCEERFQAASGAQESTSPSESAAAE